MIDDLIHVVDRSLYEEYEERARARIATRDDDDWPVVATALLIDAPIWTEDRDFFGSGIATWTSDRIELCLRDA
jgi:predicted nucleic acid-binding protein